MHLPVVSTQAGNSQDRRAVCTEVPARGIFQVLQRQALPLLRSTTGASGVGGSAVLHAMPSQGLSLHVATLLTGLLECLGFAGVLFGWASLVFVFKTEHCFEDLCEPSTGLMSNATGHDDCKAQDEKSSLILTLASFTNNFMTFPTGYIFDRFKTTVTRLIAMQLLLLPLEPGSSASAAALSSAVSSLTLMSLPCLGFALCASVPVLPLQYVTFILQVISLSFLYGGNAAFLTPAFPAEHFGKLFGLVMTLSAIVSLLQFPIFTLTKGPFQNNLFCVNMMLALVTLLTFVHPFLVHRECQQEATPATTA